MSRSKNCEMKRCFIAIPMGRPLNLAVQGSVKSAKFSSKTFDVAFEILKISFEVVPTQDHVPS